MPTYRYLCKACGHELEEFQSITADPLTKCPACKKKKLERQIGAGAGILFKGGGFYETDYRSDGYKSAAKSDSGSADGSKTDADKPDGSKTDKPEGSGSKKTDSATTKPGKKD